MTTFPVQVYNADRDHDNFFQHFRDEIYSKRKPVVIRGLNIGKATEKWNVSYLSSIVKDMPVKIHVSPVSQLDFLKKNFLYKTTSFSEFLSRVENEKQSDFFICPEEKYYLRSLGEDVRRDAANITKQFTTLAGDISFPKLFDHDRFFSSVFRISSKGLQLWTHYDVMDNLLMQVKGKKKVVFFAPKDALNLYLNGDKSEIINIENPDYIKYPKFEYVDRYVCEISPGDVLYIPALWFHNVTSLDFCISVNVFWKHLEDDMYDKKDVYGNKDLIPATRAMLSLDKILKSIDQLPHGYKDFYAKQFILKIDKKIEAWNLAEIKKDENDLTFFE